MFYKWISNNCCPSTNIAYKRWPWWLLLGIELCLLQPELVETLIIRFTNLVENTTSSYYTRNMVDVHVVSLA